MKWPKVKLGELCELVNGSAYKASDWAKEGTPIIRIQNLNDPGKGFNYWPGPLNDEVVIDENDVLLAWSGTPGTSFGAHIWKGARAVLNQHIFKVILDESRIEKQWTISSINYQLNQLIAQAHGGVGLKHATKGMIQRLEIPLPPLADQRRIAAILDKADSVRRRYKEENNLVESFFESLFIDLFGDPVANTRGWDRCRLSDIINRIDSGTSPKCLDRQANYDEWGVLKLGAVTKCNYDDGESKALPPHVNPDRDLEVKTGDLLFTRKNTHDLVAACAFVYETRPKLLLPDLIFRLRLKKDCDVIPEYLWGLFTHHRKRRIVQSLAGGSAGSMPNISKERLLKLVIETPPMNLQFLYAKRLVFCRRILMNYRKIYERSNCLFFALLERAFRGEL